MPGLLFMQTTCAAMGAFVQELGGLGDFSGPPVVMSTAEEAKFLARCVAAALRVIIRSGLFVCSSRATTHKLVYLVVALDVG